MNVLRGLIDVFSVMYPQWQTIDFQRTAEHLRVPIYIFTGKHELAARRDLALAWFKQLQAPIKQLYDYPDAGHATAFEHFQDLHRIMLTQHRPPARLCNRPRFYLRRLRISRPALPPNHAMDESVSRRLPALLPILSIEGQPLGPLLDPVQHLPPPSPATPVPSGASRSCPSASAAENGCG